MQGATGEIAPRPHGGLYCWDSGPPWGLESISSSPGLVGVEQQDWLKAGVSGKAASVCQHCAVQWWYPASGSAWVAPIGIRNSSAVFAMHKMPRMYHDVLICGRSPHFSAGNEIYFIPKVLTPRNILSDNTNLLILYTKYILKFLAHRKYKELSKWKNFV